MDSCNQLDREFIEDNNFESVEQMFQKLHEKYPLGLITRTEFYNRMDIVEQRVCDKFEVLRREHKDDVRRIDDRIDKIRNSGLIGTIIAGVLAYFGLR